jgi:ATP-dependent Zn protease
MEVSLIKDLEKPARGTPGFSGADLENMLNEAALLAAREEKEHIDTEILEKARDKILRDRKDKLDELASMLSEEEEIPGSGVSSVQNICDSGHVEALPSPLPATQPKDQPQADHREHGSADHR